MMTADYVLIVAFSLGLVGSTHCIGMCGGIMAAISSATGHNGDVSSRYKWRQLFLYNLGRISTYSLIGLLLGSVSAWLASFGANWGLVFRVIAGVSLVMMGLYLAGFGFVMMLFESSGQFIWKRIQPFARHFLPPKNWWQTLLLGGLWGWLPCGMVYGALIWSSSQGSALLSALLMFCFGLGTVPALMLTGGLSSRFTEFVSNQNIRKGLGVLVLLYGVWTLFGSMLLPGMSTHDHGAGQGNHSEHIH